MGIVNVTPDSFSDGGKNYKTSDALKSIKQMLNDGAQIIDIGAASSKPGSKLINAKEELKNILSSLPNIPSKDLPVGDDESFNVEIKKEGELINKKSPH